MGPAPLPEDGPGLIRRFLLPALFVIALFVLLWMRRPDGAVAPGEAWVVQGDAFGTTYTVKIVPDADPGYDKKAIQSQLRAVVTRINDSMSTYKPDSELSKLNQNPSTDPVAISDELAQVLDASIQVYQQSGGAFDVTIGPVINAWGFGPNKDVEPPSPAVLADAQKRVGTDKLTLSADHKTIQRALPNVYVDLSAIAKGYAVDEMGRALEKLGAANYMVEVGGEVRTRGKNPDTKPWQMGVVRPERDGAQVAELVVPLHNRSMATSGNYRNYKLKDGRVISHAMDGRTGQPVSHNLASVTVLHTDCMMADAWATALYVLGADAGLKMAEEQTLAALFLSPGPEGFVRQATTAFPTAVDKKNP